MTFDWQENDIKMAQFMFDKMAPIAKAMKPKYILGSPKNANSHFDTTTYQTTHMNRWGGNGGRSENQRREPLSAKLGRA